MSSKRLSKSRSVASSKEPASPWSRWTHPVDLYARRVLWDMAAGVPLVAGPLVRLTCERHLRDRADGGARGLVFDEARATHAIAFYPKFLRFPDGARAGESFVLSLHQQFIIGSVAGWLGSDGDLRFTTVYDEQGKANGKTPVWGGYGVYRLVTATDANQIYIAAVTADQSQIMYRDAERFVETSPLLRKRIHRSVNNLAIATSGSFLRSISSEHRSLDGKRVSLALIDEVHEHPTSLVCDKMRAGLKGQRNAQIVETTNAGYDRTSVCWAHHEYSRHILEGTIENDSWFAFIASLDDIDDPLTDTSCWIKANPNLGVSVTEKYLREQVAEAVGMPSKANIVLRLNFCVWTQAHTRAIDMGHWHECDELPDPGEYSGAPCYGGLDLGQSDDFTAWIRIWTLADGRVVVKPRFWIPASAIEKYPMRPYDQWRRAGVLEVTEGDVTDYNVVETAIAADCAHDGVREVAYDNRFAEQMAQNLTGLGITMVNTPQGFQLNEALRKLFELVVERNLCHGNDPVLSWMASNFVVRNGTKGDIRPDKEKAAEKIDGMVALTMAIDRFVKQPKEQQAWDGRVYSLEEFL